uniref:hypothetical protein n=1 Tax=Limnohabitans sp. TaxID=1907725 RepID=UPI00286F947A
GAGGTNTSSFSNKDTFYWLRGDAGSTGAVDVVWDFNATVGANTGMKLNLSDLLQNHVKGATDNLSAWIANFTTYSPAAGTLAGSGAPANTIVTSASITSMTKIVIDVDGAGAGTATQTIWLRNFTPAGDLTATTAVTNGWLVV